MDIATGILIVVQSLAIANWEHNRNGRHSATANLKLESRTTLALWTPSLEKGLDPTITEGNRRIRTRRKDGTVFSTFSTQQNTRIGGSPTS
jgi:hypothetical protein